jgi:DGQHR domain-containing protein
VKRGRGHRIQPISLIKRRRSGTPEQAFFRRLCYSANRGVTLPDPRTAPALAGAFSTRMRIPMPEDAAQQMLSYTASLVSQGKHRFYTLTMPADVLARTCFVIARDEDPIEGFQRLLNKDRAQQIADYIDSGLGTIPTSIVLSAQEEADFEYTTRTKSVSFKDFSKSFLVLDGQHRVYGFLLAKSDLRVPVVIYNGLSRTDESRLFIDINTKQKPVPNELLLDIRKLADYQNDIETRLGEVFDLFDTEPGSPLIGKMSPSTRKKDHISRVTFNAATKPLLKLFGEASSLEVYKLLSSYFGAFLRQIRSRDIKIDVTNPIAFRGMTIVFPDIVQRVRDKFGPKYTIENFENIIEEMLDNVRASSLKAAGNSASSYAKVLSDALKPRSIF